MANTRVIQVVVAGTILRLVLFTFGVDSLFHNRHEFITPLNSLKRLQEGAFLYKTGLSPYSGDVFHQPPLVLLLYLLMETTEHVVSMTNMIYLTMVLFDIIIALGFASLCRNFVVSVAEQQCERSKIWLNHPPVSPLLTPENLPAMAAAVYLFNPFSLISSLAMSTNAMLYAAMIWSLSFAMRGRLVPSIFYLSIATYLNLYPIVLFLPILLMVHQVGRTTMESKINYLSITKSIISLVLFSGFISMWLYLSFIFLGSWSFLDATYLWILRYPDLTPNIGLFWYFFMEMFERFQQYFLFLLHIHPYLYVIPLFIRLRSRPLPFACILLAIFSIFQPYPSLGDVGFVLSCTILHPSSILGMSNKFILTTGIVVASVLMPVMGFLWLFPGSGNGNFFYNQTLVFQLFYLKLIGQFLFSTLRCEKQLDEYYKLNN